MIESLKKLFKSTIGRMLVMRIILFSGFITLCISVYQVYDDYTNEISSIKSDILQIQKAYQNPLALSLWNFNENQVKQIITGISNFPAINFLQIEDADSQLYFNAGVKESDTLVFNLPLIFKESKKLKQKVGSLYIQASKKPIIKKIKNRIFIIILSQGIKTFIVSLFIIFLIKITVTDHLHDISNGLTKLSPEILKKLNKDTSAQTIKLNKVFHNDEIDMVTQKINSIAKELALSYMATQTFSKNLETLVEKRTLELKEAMLKNENLIRVLIHDIGNPLSGVIFGIDRISKQYSLKEEIQSSKIKMVQESCDKILEIINFIKDIKSLESGKKQLALTKIDLFPVIEKLKEDFTHQLRAKKLQLDTTYSKKPLYVYAERVSLTNSILSNLLSNAIKFSHFNSFIKVHCSTIGNKTLISIKNFNAVIESSNIKELFNPFKATTTQGLGGEEGTGFGLPIVKMFTQYNNGQIEVNSTENETEFLLYLQSEKGP
jgi:signal transduction histidine kinase